MPRYTGNDGVVLVGANAVANVRRWSLDIEGDEIDVPAMGDSARQRLAGKPNVTGEIEVWYDDSDTTGQGALTQGATVALELRPRGTGSGLPEFTLSSARVISEGYSGEVDQGMPTTFRFTSDTTPDRTAQS